MPEKRIYKPQKIAPKKLLYFMENNKNENLRLIDIAEHFLCCPQSIGYRLKQLRYVYKKKSFLQDLRTKLKNTPGLFFNCFNQKQYTETSKQQPEIFLTEHISLHKWSCFWQELERVRQSKQAWMW